MCLSTTLPKNSPGNLLGGVVFFQMGLECALTETQLCAPTVSTEEAATLLHGPGLQSLPSGEREPETVQYSVPRNRPRDRQGSEQTYSPIWPTLQMTCVQRQARHGGFLSSLESYPRAQSPGEDANFTVHYRMRSEQNQNNSRWERMAPGPSKTRAACFTRTHAHAHSPQALG